MRDRRLWERLAGVLMLAVLHHAFAWGGDSESRVSGWIASRGPVLVNNEPALRGTSLFAGDVVATGKGSMAVMNLRAGTSVTLAENSEVALSPEPGPNLTLRRGVVIVRSGGLLSTRVSVLGASVIVQGQASFPAICRIASVGRSAAVIAQRGRVEIHGAGAPLMLSPGRYAKLEAGTPQGAAQQAGKVSVAIPAEVVQRQGAGPEITLKLNDPVHWNDVVKTLRTGRLRIELLEGSFLNVGARSTMRITRHDPQTQQTEIELTLGRLRGEVVKIAKPGGSFQVRTQTAVIGVVGTVFLIQALANLTRVHCIEGLLTVRNINPAIVGQVTLGAGQLTSVPRALPPAGVVRSAPSQLRAEVNQTNVQPPTTPAGVQPAAGGQAAPSAASTATSAATTASQATSATLSSVTVAEIGEVTTILQGTTTALESASTAVTAATTAASSTVATTSATTLAVQEVVTVVSPSQPDCRCL